jgi:hypothetical protein
MPGSRRQAGEAWAGDWHRPKPPAKLLAMVRLLFRTPTMPNEQVVTYIAEKLREGESIDRIVTAIKGMRPEQARDLVLQVRSLMKWEVRKQAFWKMLGSLVLLLIFGGIFLATGRLFFIILPFAAAGFLWGAIQLVFAVGYDAD